MLLTENLSNNCLSFSSTFLVVISLILSLMSTSLSTSKNTSTKLGSNWVPAHLTSSSLASFIDLFSLYGLEDIIASKLSTIETMRLFKGISSPLSPSG